MSNVPSWRCVTGIPTGESSEERTDVKDDRAETILASGAWKAGEMLEMMVGVRTRTEGFGEAIESGCWCEVLGEARSGRKDCKVRIGVIRRVFRRSLSVEGDRVAIGAEG